MSRKNYYVEVAAVVRLSASDAEPVPMTVSIPVAAEDEREAANVITWAILKLLPYWRKP